MRAPGNRRGRRVGSGSGRQSASGLELPGLRHFDRLMTEWAIGKAGDAAAYLDGTAKPDRLDLIGQALLAIPPAFAWWRYLLIARYLLGATLNEATAYVQTRNPYQVREGTLAGLGFVEGFVAAHRTLAGAHKLRAFRSCQGPGEGPSCLHIPTTTQQGDAQ